jgi:hypothetical protein
MRNQNRGGNRGPQRPGRNEHHNGGKPGRQNAQGDGNFKKHHIGKRDHDGKGRRGGPRDGKGGRDKKADDRDLDRELRDYWIGQKGNNADIGTYGLKQTQRRWQGRS